MKKYEPRSRLDGDGPDGGAGNVRPRDAKWRRGTARIEGVRLRWTELGSDTRKPPLVLLHGLHDSSRTWRLLAPQLARDRRVLMPDLPGHGLSDRPDASYTLSWYSHMMARWLDAAGCEQADVVGHSFGGGVAMMMLLEPSPRVRRLVLMSSGGLGRKIAISLRLASLPFVVEQFGEPFMALGTKLASKATGDVVSKREVARLGAMNAQAGSARAFARTVRDIIDLRGQRRTLFKHAHELPVLPPIAVFWGDRDAVIPFSHAEALVDFFGGVRITRFEGCGHFPHHEQPRLFVDSLRAFIDAPTAPRANINTRAPAAATNAWEWARRRLGGHPVRARADAHDAVSLSLATVA